MNQKDINKWLDENQDLLNEITTLEEMIKKNQEDFGNQQIIVDSEPSKFKEYYDTDEGRKKEYIRRRTPEARYAKARYDAGRRFSGAKEFSLTLNEYKDIISKPCRYCNCDISQETGSGLDRILNEQGYITGNVSPCCGSCNQRRSKSMSANEFERQSKLNGYWNES